MKKQGACWKTSSHGTLGKDKSYSLLFSEGKSIIIHYPYLPTPLLKQDMTQGQFLSGV